MTSFGRLFRIAIGSSVVVGAASLLVISIFSVCYMPGWHHSTISGYRPTLETADFNRTDFITVILTAVTVILGALAIILAIAGAIGYATVKGAAVAEARQVAGEVAERVASDRTEIIAPRVAEIVAARVAEEQVARSLGGIGATGSAYGQAEGGTDA